MDDDTRSDYETMVNACIAHLGIYQPHEQEFLDDMLHKIERGDPLTPNQGGWLERLYTRAERRGRR